MSTLGQSPSAAAVSIGHAAELKQELGIVAARLDSEVRAANLRFEAVTRATDRAFQILLIFGTVGTLLGGSFTFLSLALSWRRDKHERSLLDALSNRAEALHAAVSKQSADMLSQQIEGISKLSGVIGLVKQAFEIQITRAGDVDMLVKTLQEDERQLDGYATHFRDQYKGVRSLVLPFREHSRIQWTRLTQPEQMILTRALTTFATIPKPTLVAIRDEDGGRYRYELADFHELLGVGAFYTNDVEAAARCLTAALELYGDGDVPKEHVYPQAFCSHYLGLIEKNWPAADLDPSASLAAARRHLERAVKQLEEKDGEFLTPLTLAEVLSYSDQTRTEAIRRLDSLLARLDDRRRGSQGLDANQRILLVRTLLMRGAVAFATGDRARAITFYLSARDEDAANPYVLLSLAQAHEENVVEQRQLFRAGLEALEASGALGKSEASSRVLALSWAVIAAQATGDQALTSHYLRECDAMSAHARRIGQRAPVFFCPLTKALVTFEQLRQNLIGQIQSK